MASSLCMWRFCIVNLATHICKQRGKIFARAPPWSLCSLDGESIVSGCVLWLTSTAALANNSARSLQCTYSTLQSDTLPLRPCRVLLEKFMWNRNLRNNTRVAREKVKHAIYVDLRHNRLDIAYSSEAILFNFAFEIQTKIFMSSIFWWPSLSALCIYS